MRQGSKFILLYVAIQLPHHHLKRHFSPLNGLGILVGNQLTMDRVICPSFGHSVLNPLLSSPPHRLECCGSIICWMVKAQQPNTTRNTPIIKHIYFIELLQQRRTHPRTSRASRKEGSERSLLQCLSWCWVIWRKGWGSRGQCGIGSHEEVERFSDRAEFLSRRWED